jgi:hypothetical protein
MLQKNRWMLNTPAKPFVWQKDVPERKLMQQTLLFELFCQFSLTMKENMSIFKLADYITYVIMVSIIHVLGNEHCLIDYFTFSLLPTFTGWR